MLEIINLPVETTIEYNFHDLPPSLVEHIKFHLLEEEKPHFCVVVKADSAIIIEIITPIRIIKTHVEIKKGVLNFSTSRNVNKSMILAEFTGLEQSEGGPPESVAYYLSVLTHTEKLGFIFWDKEIFFKFARAIVYFADQQKSNRTKIKV